MGGLLGLLGANVPALILLLVGVGLLVFEMYIPGFGVPGTLGIGSLVMGFVVLKPSMEQGLLLFVVLAAVLCVALSLALKDVALDPNAAASNDLNYFIGKTGVTRTALRPAGMAEFDGVKLNVVSDGEFIGQGVPIRVQKVAGNRIVVAEIEA